MNEEQTNPEETRAVSGDDDVAASAVPEDVGVEASAQAETSGEAAGAVSGDVEEVAPDQGAPDVADSGDAGEAADGAEDGDAASDVGEAVDAGDDDAEDVDAAPVWVPEADKLLLSLLFASHEYLDARSLREIMGPEWDTPRLRQLVRKLNREFEAGDMPFEIAETEGTFRLRTLPKYFPWTRKLFKDSAPRRLSQAALETLAIVAYKQPVTKAEIESIRGVNVDGSMKTLLDKRLIDIGRRSDALGQAFTYHTTREFMRYFGISRVPDDLPRLSEFEGILNAQSLLPQMDAEGEAHVMEQGEPDPEQMSLGMSGGEEESGVGRRESGED